MNADGDLFPDPNRDWALFLDIDGTLIDIADTPSAVTVPSGLPLLLGDLVALFDGAIALVSGRPLVDIDRLLAPLRLPAAGQHGAEIRLPGGQIETEPQNRSELAAVLPDLKAFARGRPGLLIEEKGRTIAIHYRLAPQYEAELVAFLKDVADAHPSGLETIYGHRVFELKPRSFNKGTAVQRFMRSATFAGRRPVFIGDDRTDEDGFAIVRALGGHAIRVGMEGPSIAELRIGGPAETRAWLVDVRDRLTQETG